MVEIKNIKENPRDFTFLDCWKKCREVKLVFYREIIPELPSEEKYNLGDQIRRAAISTTSNIAEGYGRFYYQESIQFYRISRGSLYELLDHLISCYDLDFVDQSMFDHLRDDITEAIRLVNGFIRYAQEQKQTGVEK